MEGRAAKPRLERRRPCRKYLVNKYEPLPGKTARGMRTAGLAAAATGVQGTFLYRAIFEVPTFGAWMLWLVVFVLLVIAFTYAGVRDSRLNRA